MTDWDRLLLAIIVLAALAVLAASSAGATSIKAVGDAIAQLASNIVGTSGGNANGR